MTEISAMNDSMTLHIPRWISTLANVVGELVLLVITIVIITAMWLPAYLNSRGQTANAAEHSREDAFSGFPRGR